MIAAPHILTPTHDTQYNLSTVLITWDPPILFSEIGIPTGDPYDPYRFTLEEAQDITYEIEYTDNYQSTDTNWYTLKRRIPFTDTSYSWKVGKMIKSSSVRIRMRTKHLGDEIESDWSISEQFSINVFDLIAPAIINPVPNMLYADFILVILDETLTRNTYHQKVRYTLEYSSEKQSVIWTTIAVNLPVGQNIIRWNIESLPTSDDYILKLTAQNQSSCLEPPVSEPDQIARSYVYNISIQQSGLFIIDTLPPEAVLNISGNENVTNQINQVLNIFAEDETTEVKQIQIRECNATNDLSLGDLAGLGEAGEGERCPPLVLDGSIPFDRLISDTPIGNLSKIQWQLDATDSEGNPISAIKKLEALLSDVGGNNSLQENVQIFLSVFDAGTVTINDFLIRIEQRDKVVFGEGGERTISTAVFEVLYLGTSTGQLWVLEPFSRLIYSLAGAAGINKLHEFNGVIYIFSYDEETSIGKAYRHDVSEATELNVFTGTLTRVNASAEYNNFLYAGMENGELWRFDGSAFVLIQTFDSPISSLFGNNSYLYIGFRNSSVIDLYNGTSFTELEVE
ncbi:hypothetical protein LCGC14_0575900 [marine sediment metagenome]|uniref:Uncharacterized protein n=1 Tax=marine sediment metagenome TaxID=412755 RepID=A0A0F9U440_9ZZZZ